ncbi:hypothetical protein [Flavobacterium sp.]|jgi:hypothetical protein|uniref:hypothetical protein n=1 Tax=Flavobacterium sp. TaxID=239 RepID=UPI0037BE5B6F
MKKFMFSAIAMMAFSVSSMGNTIELTSDNLEVQVNSNTFELDEAEVSALRFFLTRCDVIFIRTLAIAIGEGFNEEQAGSIAMGAFRACDEVEQGLGN